MLVSYSTVADPGFPVGGGVDLVGGHGLPRRLRFVKFVCQNERIGSLSYIFAMSNWPYISRDSFNVIKFH